MTKKNSVGNTFEAVPMKLGAPFGEHWVLVSLPNEPPKEIYIGRFSDSFANLEEAERWIDEHMEDLDYRVRAK